MEFAGMFPPYEEFVNTLVNNPDDWPKSSYRVFLEALEANSALPEALVRSKDWATTNKWDELPFGSSRFYQACNLMHIIKDITPWWIKKENNLSEEELCEQLRRCRVRMEKCIGLCEESVKREAEKKAAQ
jgi:hypothetical protein